MAMTEEEEKESAMTDNIRETLKTCRWLVVNSSGGKDSQAMLDYVHREVVQAGLVAADRVVVVHADLGRMEWEGTKELAEEQAKFYGYRFIATHRVTAKGVRQDLLEHVRERKAQLVRDGKPDTPAWPSSTTRYCTSDHKRGPVRKIWTRLVKEAGPGKHVIVNAMGLRSQESPARAKRQPWARSPQSNGKREVFEWLPIQDWKVEQVWETIKASGCPHHRAYDLGMPRLSCVFCIFSPLKALLLAGKHNQKLLDEYVQVEKEVGSSFRINLKLVDVQRDVKAGLADDLKPEDVGDWCM